MSTLADLIELDLPGTVVTPEPATVPAPFVPAALPVSDFGAPVLNAQALPLIAEEDAALAKHGVGDGDLFFDKGTALADIGHANLVKYDKAYKALPELDTSLDAFRATITAEARKDTVTNLRDFRLDHGGKLTRVSGGNGVDVEDHAWSQLTQIAGTANVNAGLSKGNAALTRRVRARTLNGTDRSVFAIVSGGKRGYAVCDANQAADLFQAGLKEAGFTGGKAEVKYDAESTSWKIRAILQAPIDIPAFSGVGRVHQVFADLSGADNGSERLRGGIGAIRIRCLNASLSQTDAFSFSKVHRGDATALQGLVAQIPNLFAPLAKDLSDVWAKAAANHYLDAEGANLSPEEAIRRLVANEYLPTCGLTPEKAADTYLAAWRAEDSPYSAQGIIMAVQRAAHEGSWTTKWSDTAIEEAASNLLYQPVYTLDNIELS